MTAFAALLRAVNVGGRNKVAMGALKDLCSSLGFEMPTTILQSGNVVFSAAGPGAAAERRLQEGLRAKLGVDTEVMIRTTSELRKIMGANPFDDAARSDPGHLVVVFLSEHPGKAAAGGLSRAYTGPEPIHVAGRELYIHYTEGIGRSKLTAAVIERALGVSCTARNWNTLGKILAVAEGLK